MIKTSDFQEYAERHQLFQLFSQLLADIVVDQPEDPISWLIDALKNDGIQFPFPTSDFIITFI